MTLRLNKLLAERCETLCQQWMNGNFVASFEAEFIARHAAAQGVAAHCKELLELDIQDLFEESNE